jgi:hypothetical protein
VGVDCRDLDAVLTQRSQDRVHLLGDQDEIAGDCRLTAISWLKIDWTI